MPEVTREIDAVLVSFQRCKAFNVLPYGGGVLEQPEWLMQLFDTIEATRQNCARREQERQEMERTRVMLEQRLG